MSGRSYRQYCGVAHALDLVGDRWTLLAVRELLTGPKRFKDLLDGLRGIGTNLLAARLKQLEASAIVQRTMLPPAGVPVYALTDLGRGLEPVVLALGRWGQRTLGPWDGTRLFKPGWALLGLRDRFRAEAAAGLRETYELRIGEDVFHVRVEDGAIDAGQGAAQAPALALACTAATLIALATGERTLEGAVRAGDLQLSGDPAALARFGRLFALP